MRIPCSAGVVLTAIACFIQWGTGSVVALATDQRPNLIFLMADDQCTYSLGCYGNNDVQTPNLDQLARDGIVFDNHYVTTAICMASRATVMTGRFEFKTGCNFTHGDMRLDTWKTSYPVLLRRSGYRTAFAGKIGFDVADQQGEHRLKLANEFDRWGGGPGQTSYKTKANASMAAYADKYPHSTLSYGAFGRDFIQNSAISGQPFCLSISFKAPHKPAEPDPAFDAVYQNNRFRKPDNFGREYGTHFSKQSKTDRQYERFFSWNYADDYDGVMAKYHQQVYGIDQAVGMIRKALKQCNVDHNTVIIYTSDNGFLCGSHGYGSKVLPYEESSRVPLIVFDPRSPRSGQNRRCDALTGNCDFMPTLLTLAGVPVPQGTDGGDLMAIYEDPSQSIHESLPLINVWGNPATHSLSVVTKDHKYILWSYAGDGFEASEEFYDTANDPLELVNLAGNNQQIETLRLMRRRYDAYVRQWAKESVPYNGYPRYATVFDRNLPWSEKAALTKRSKSQK
ncbi:sulfatase family protein [Crateriforma conspicua]|uniref:sulfatase family protein n=1 Tax=Crateriforma conspicua TaxID=2527996 RepID=UPI00118CAF2A|nr:sulfatase [Crateriforma conspicua]QDV66012.1 Arylsulfatase [Crateriforma conspicua]